jgi:hypothetical protein
MVFMEIIVIYSENMKHVNKFCGQNVELLKVKTGGAYSYHMASITVTRKHLHNTVWCTPEGLNNSRMWVEISVAKGKHYKSSVFVIKHVMKSYWDVEV